MTVNPITKEQIQQGLLNLGLKPGDHVMLHSSLKSFGLVDGGAETVLNAVLETVGDEGTLLVPTFTFLGSVTVYLRGLTEIDLRTSPSLMGKITETARTRPDFLRSSHPTHPVAGKGKLSADLLSEHHLDDTAAGALGPYGKLAEHERGYILLAGVGNGSNTMIHTAEQYYTPYIFNGETFAVNVTTPEGSVIQVQVKGYCVGTPRNFPVIDRYLEEAGALRRAHIGKSVVTLINARAMMEVLKKKLQEDPYLLLDPSAR